MTATILLKIDHREQKLKELFRACELSGICTIEEENLAHGDIQLWLDSKIIYLFERKRLDDLEASIKDGRYKNQKSVLLQSGYSRSQIYYIIEGPVTWSSSSKQSIPPMIKGSIINTLLRDKMGMFFTQTITDTRDLLLEIIQRIVKDPGQYTETSAIEKQIVTLSTNEKVTPSICFRHMLCQVPSISIKSAEAIAETFGSMKEMIQTLDPLDSEDKQKRLSAIKVNGRKISSKIVENLLSYLF
jgi:ERCC4-type nuclease